MKKNKVSKQAMRTTFRALLDLFIPILKIGMKSNDISKDKKVMTIYIEYSMGKLVTYFSVPTNYKN